MRPRATTRRMYPNMRFAKTLDELLEEHPDDAQDIAAAAGVSPQAMSRYRTAERLPRTEDAIRRLADAVATDDPDQVFERLRKAAEADQRDSERQESPSRQSYPLLTFAKVLDELLEASPQSAKSIAQRAELSPQTLSGYRKGESLPKDEAKVRLLAAAVATDDVDTVFEELWHAAWVDQYDYELRRFGHSVADARRYIKEVERRRAGES